MNDSNTIGGYTPKPSSSSHGKPPRARTSPPTGLKRWRYRVDTAWGSLRHLLTDDEPTFLLEDHDRGEQTEWTVMNFTTGEVTGGASGILTGVTDMCECTNALVSTDHDCGD